MKDLQHAFVRDYLESMGYVKQGSRWSEITERTNRAFSLLKQTLKPGRPRKIKKLVSNLDPTLGDLEK